MRVPGFIPSLPNVPSQAAACFSPAHAEVLLAELLSATSTVCPSLPGRQWRGSVRGSGWPLEPFVSFTPSSFLTHETDFKYQLLMDPARHFCHPACHQPLCLPVPLRSPSLLSPNRPSHWSEFSYQLLALCIRTSARSAAALHSFCP